MKERGWLYLFLFFLCGMFIFSSAEAINKTSGMAKSCIVVKTSTPTSQKQHTGDSPFIRFHHGIDENGVTVSTPNELIISLKPVNDTPEKFAGILEYLSTLSHRLPVTREIFYSTPLRSPPALN
jgi:hypothetical protein